MRLHCGVPMLALIVSAAAIASPTAARAQAISAGTGGGAPVAVQIHHPASVGTDWGLIGAGTAGGVLVVGAGMTMTRRRGRVATHRATGTVA